jgi:diguanylate cyclase (GGDEF)-like protein
MVQQKGITSVYSTPLAKDSFATNAFGVMSICTTQPNGFTEEEKGMIDELSGDLGFAINSFFQKENIIRLSYYDPLTELPNRHLLMERFEQAMRVSSRTHHYGALLFIDLDNFKGINDLKGHIRGDDVLREMGLRLLAISRQSDTIARFGGDEFVMLLQNIGTDPHKAANTALTNAQKILEVTKEPFILENESFYLTASVGIVLFDGEQLTAHELLAYADGAMYAAKNGGRNTIRFYDAALQAAMATQAKMVQELRAAIEAHSLYLVYQGQVDQDGKMVGVEALLRWDHPENGAVPPSLFIPVAEESGMIVALGEWILETAIGTIVQWSSDPIRHTWRVSVNVSPKQFEQPGFVPMLRRLLSASRIDPAKLRLELTEGLLIRDTQQAMEKINELKQIGFTLSIDDFGTGYSSLSYLKHLPIDELKIDQSFVRSLPQSSSDQTIVQTMITIAEAFGFDVIAEGVETKEQFEILKKLGCRLYQGYLFSRPQKIESDLAPADQTPEGKYPQ